MQKYDGHSPEVTLTHLQIEVKYSLQALRTLPAHVAQQVEHTLGKGGVMGSIPIVGFWSGDHHKLKLLHRVI